MSTRVMYPAEIKEKAIKPDNIELLKDCSLKTREERVQLGNFVSFFG
ncbi:hypothetical protein [Listeria monocytogenes]|nr:hypothetical protein [Listeria monocytogenes]